LYKKLNAECNKQAMVVSPLLTTLGDGGRAMDASRSSRYTHMWSVYEELDIVRRRSIDSSCDEPWRIFS